MLNIGDVVHYTGWRDFILELEIYSYTNGVYYACDPKAKCSPQYNDSIVRFTQDNIGTNIFLNRLEAEAK